MLTLLEKFLFSIGSVDRETFGRVNDCFKLVTTKRKQTLLQPGEVCRHCYFVNQGCLRMFALNKEGLENTRFFAFEGSFGTALPSFISKQPASEYIQTVEASQLLVITRDDFYRLLEEVPILAKIYQTILENGIMVAQERIYGFQGDNALQKLKWIKGHQPQLLSRVSNKLAASFLGLSPSTLSRLKRLL